ncbi:hypothetical protein D3C86_1956260 [compost metagenome]
MDGRRMSFGAMAAEKRVLYGLLSLAKRTSRLMRNMAFFGLQNLTDGSNLPSSPITWVTSSRNSSRRMS